MRILKALVIALFALTAGSAVRRATSSQPAPVTLGVNVADPIPQCPSRICPPPQQQQFLGQ